MRKGFFLFAVLLSCASVIHAQHKYAAGLKAGVNFYNLESDAKGAQKTDGRLSVNAGVFYHVPIVGGFSIQPEILYSGEGAKYDDKVAKTDNIIRLQYLTIPLMLQWNFQDFYVEAGPQLGVLVQGKQIITPQTGAKTTLDLLSKNLKTTSVSVGGGIGYHQGMFGGYARYNHGLSNLSKIDGDPKITTSGFQVGVSFWFNQ